MVRFIFATGVLCSVSVVADVGTIDINGTRVTYDYLPFGEWSKQQTELIGGGHAQVVGSEYSNYRAKLAKGAYCAQIHRDNKQCIVNVEGAHTDLVQQCISTRTNYTVTAELGASALILNGSASVTIEASNKSDCIELSHAYRDLAVAKCDLKLADIKVQTAKQGFCK